MNTRNLLLVAGLILLQGWAIEGVSQAPTLSVSGIVTDSLTGEPIPFLTVFIPNSTKAALTNENGEFTLKRIPLNTNVLVFSHLNYGTRRISVGAALAKGNQIRVVLSARTFPLEEVRITEKQDRAGKRNREHYLHLFFTYFLGDPTNYKCRLTNPEAVLFHKTGNLITARARVPLIIENTQLGYRITYYLDSFIFCDSVRTGRGGIPVRYYAYSGEQFFEEMVGEAARQARWKTNREKTYTGSLSYFLNGVYQNTLTEAGYHIFQAYASIPVLRGQLEKSESISKRNSRRDYRVDSVFYFDQVKGKSGYLYYASWIPYPINDHITPGRPDSGKALQTTDSLLVFRDYLGSGMLKDNDISLFHIGTGELVFYPGGDYRVYNANLLWSSLDSQKKIISTLPENYSPALQ